MAEPIGIIIQDRSAPDGIQVNICIEVGLAFHGAEILQSDSLSSSSPESGIINQTITSNLVSGRLA